MLTDSPPRKANRARFLESERIRALDLPQDGCLLAIAKSIESAMKEGENADVRNACAEFLAATSEFYRTPNCNVRVLAARPLRVRENRATELFVRLQSRDHADPSVDADSGARGGHFLRHVPERPVPRILPPSRYPAVRVPGLVAHTWFLRASRCALPLCAGNAPETFVLGALWRAGAGRSIG